MIDVKTLTLGYLDTNCYIVTDIDTGKKAVIDPGSKSVELVEMIKKSDAASFEYILLTHGHFDHIWFSAEVKKLTGAKIAVSRQDANFLKNGELNLSSVFGIRDFPQICPDVLLENSHKFYLGNTELTYICTPGHTVGSGCFISFSDKIIFSGDTLFRLSAGRTDFPTGDSMEMQSSLKKLLSLSGDFEVYPGHGEKTSLEYERKNNPYVSV